MLISEKPLQGLSRSREVRVACGKYPPNESRFWWAASLPGCSVLQQWRQWMTAVDSAGHPHCSSL